MDDADLIDPRRLPPSGPVEEIAARESVAIGHRAKHERYERRSYSTDPLQPRTVRSSPKRKRTKSVEPPDHPSSISHSTDRCISTPRLPAQSLTIPPKLSILIHPTTVPRNEPRSNADVLRPIEVPTHVPVKTHHPTHVSERIVALVLWNAVCLPVRISFKSYGRDLNTTLEPWRFTSQG